MPGAQHLKPSYCDDILYVVIIFKVMGIDVMKE